MVRSYIKKTNRQEWSRETMQQAVEAVVSGSMGYKKASDQYNVPQTTLERYVQKRRNDPEAIIDKTALKFKCVFTTEQEAELSNYLLSMQKQLFGLTQKECRKLAYQLAERNQCKHSFNTDSAMAGEAWMSGFLLRHPEQLTLRKPESTSGARAMGFNKVAVGQFFDLLTQIIDEKKITGERIYNCDETGISCVPKQHSRIIASKGQRQVGVLTSSERGTTVTAEICCSASGVFMPPMLIFPRKKKQQEFELGLPPGAWSEANESGWMTSEVFCKWFKKFINFSNASREMPVLLLLDGHASHTKNLDVIDLARNNGVIILCFPPHCSHRLQPLDVAFMKPLSLYYESEVRRWLRTNPGKVVTFWQISSLFGSAYMNSANMKSAINGFEKTGIWPTDINVFTDVDFLPSKTTDIRMAEVPAANLSNNPSVNPPVDPSSEESESRPGCSWMSDPPANSKVTMASPSFTSFPSLSPEHILPIPKVKPGQKRVTRKRGKTTILTASPYKAELEEAANNAKKTKEAKENRVKRKLWTDNEKKKENTQKTINEEIKKNTQKTGIKKQKKNTQKIVNKKPRKQHVKSDEEEMTDSFEEEGDATCLYCKDLYSKSSEGWISCIQCKKWAHNSCAGIDSDDDESQLICELCQPKTMI